MKKAFILCAVAVIITFLSSCSKKTSSSNNGSFTPPTTNFLKLDAKEHDSASAYISYGTSNQTYYISRANFTNPSYIPPVTNIYGFTMQITGLTYTNSSQYPNYMDMHDSIPEGQYKKYTLSGVDEGSHRLGFSMYATTVISETYTTSTGNASAPDTYYLTGNIYVSKLNGKLRFTTDGVITLTNTNNSVLQHTISFSIAEDAGTF
jgi:hypothetical protein